MAIDRALVNSVFGRVLKGLAKENDRTQQAIADHLGQNVVTINRIFGGKRDITVTQFLQIVEFCGEDPHEALTRVLSKLRAMSKATDNVIALKPVGDMTDDEIDAIQIRAAINDEELEQDEPDPT